VGPLGRSAREESENMQFGFETAARIAFGAGCRREVVPCLQGWGARRVFISVGRQSARAAWLLEELSTQGIEARVWSVPREPRVEDARQAVEAAREHGAEAVIALGGGSAIDLGKGVAALAANPGDVFDYLEVVGAGRPLMRPGLPCIAVPTTAGTGAEVTKNSVFEVPEHGVKVSLRSSFILPKLAVVDPELMLDVPKDVTAHTGFDALAQVIEPFLSKFATPLTDPLCRDAIVRGSRALLRAYQDGRDLEARTDMAFTSLMGGLALANARLGAVHGFAGPLGGSCHAPHGALCAALLPATLEVNLRALRERGEPRFTERFAELAGLLTGRAAAEPEEAIRVCRELQAALHIPRLRELGVSFEAARALIPAAQRSSSMKGNPLELTVDELEQILAGS
jgi:alcohol dehydrogenase class IV